jgi:Acyl-CoA dehydrogenase, C-terminal domain
MAEASYTPTMEDRAHMRWTINRGVNQVGDAVVDLFRAASGRSIFTADPVQKRFQDVQAGLAHAYLVPDALGLAVGGNRLGTSKPQLVM